MNKIVIITTLKPCNEVRIYERFALSLAKPNKYEINIIGLPSKKLSKPKSGIQFHYLKKSGRSLKNRILSILEIRGILNEIKPELLILTTPQLLPLGVFYKFLYRRKIIYDIQEDYFKNIRYQKVYRWPANLIYAYLVRAVERLTCPLVDHYFLAEQCYERTLAFTESRYTIIENKYHPIYPDAAKKNHRELRLVFTGIISEYSGILTAINFYKKWKKNDPKISFVIAGYTFQDKIIKVLQDLSKEDDSVTLIGVDHFVDHEQIIREINQADLGLVCHQYTNISSEKIPSKLYEYAHLALPYVIEEGTNWMAVGKTLGGAIPIDFNEPDYEKIKAAIKNASIFFPKDHKLKTDWYTEELKLLRSIKRLIKEI